MYTYFTYSIYNQQQQNRGEKKERKKKNTTVCAAKQTLAELKNRGQSSGSRTASINQADTETEHTHQYLPCQSTFIDPFKTCRPVSYTAIGLRSERRTCFNLSAVGHSFPMARRYMQCLKLRKYLYGAGYVCTSVCSLCVDRLMRETNSVAVSNNHPRCFLCVHP